MTRIDLRCDCGCNPPQAYEYRMSLNGEDLSDRCFSADDVRGEVGLYRKDATGRFYKEWDSAAIEWCAGVVVLVPPA